MIICGIDPSLNESGWAVVSFLPSSKPTLLDCGTIKFTAGGDYVVKVAQIGAVFSQVIRHHKPNFIAMEETICNKNPSSSLKLGMVRGAFMAIAGQNDITIKEYKPKAAKLAIVGSGNAEKNQVSFIIKQTVDYGSIKLESLDITDAIAIAITHFYHQK